jgi:hypothetical protein
MLVAAEGQPRETTENWAYGGPMHVTHYIGSFEPERAHGFLVDYRPAPGNEIEPHFHHVRQFQVVVRGDDRCVVGKHAVPALSFHYTDPDSPYGPIRTGADGITFFTLRARSSKGTYWMPGAGDEMVGRAGRNVVVNVPDGGAPDGTPGRTALLEPHDDGLAVYRLRIPAGEEATGPDPSAGDGQFHLVWQGALVHDGQLLGPRSLAWVEPSEPPARLVAGADGADVVVFQFPWLSPRLAAAEDLADVEVGRRFLAAPA